MSEDIGKRSITPQKVRIAVWFLYLAVGIEVVRTIIARPISTQQISQINPEITPEIGHLITGGAIFLMVICCCFFLFLIFMISRRRNWARITYFVLFLIGVPFCIYGIGGAFERKISLGISSIGALGIEIVAWILLFQRQSSEWFRVREIPGK